MAYPNNKETIKKDWTNITETKYTHPNEHNLVGEVVEALQDKVGIDGDANTDSFDYKLSTVTGSDKVAPKTSTDQAIANVQQNLTDHENDTNNPHSVTKEQVGLGNVSDNLQVKQAGDQSIDGVKTFTSSPIVPTPTTDMQATTKKYVDDNTGETMPWTIIGTAEWTNESTSKSIAVGTPYDLIMVKMYGTNVTANNTIGLQTNSHTTSNYDNVCARDSVTTSTRFLLLGYTGSISGIAAGSPFYFSYTLTGREGTAQSFTIAGNGAYSSSSSLNNRSLITGALNTLLSSDLTNLTFITDTNITGKVIAYGLNL